LEVQGLDYDVLFSRALLARSSGAAPMRPFATSDALRLSSLGQGQ